MKNDVAGDKSQANLYAVLGVPRDASPDEIKHAYRSAARRYHPDTGELHPDGSRGDPERFKHITEAYSVLSDAERRRAYDLSLSASPQRNGAAPPPPKRSTAPGAWFAGSDTPPPTARPARNTFASVAVYTPRHAATTVLFGAAAAAAWLLLRPLGSAAATVLFPVRFPFAGLLPWPAYAAAAVLGAAAAIPVRVWAARGRRRAAMVAGAGVVLLAAEAATVIGVVAAAGWLAVRRLRTRRG